MSASPALAGIQAILLDIEGTTTPVRFVYDVLFPYARRRLQSHVEEHATAPEYDVLFDRLRDEHAADLGAGETLPPWVDAPPAARVRSIVSYLDWLMERDRKSTALKELQGRIWEEGYRRAELVGEVFADVPTAFERWRAQDLRIGIFSSGSVLAQQLLFRHSSAGDLTRFVQWHFDTTIGRKTDSESYRRIAQSMALPADDVLFISDIVGELDAAREAGMQTRLSIRPGNKKVADEYSHAAIDTFDAIS